MHHPGCRVGHIGVKFVAGKPGQIRLIQPDDPGVAADKAKHIGPPRQRGEIAAIKRNDVAFGDAGAGGDIRGGQAQCFARGTQPRTGCRRRDDRDRRADRFMQSRALMVVVIADSGYGVARVVHYFLQPLELWESLTQAWLHYEECQRDSRHKGA